MAQNRLVVVRYLTLILGNFLLVLSTSICQSIVLLLWLYQICSTKLVVFLGWSVHATALLFNTKWIEHNSTLFIDIGMKILCCVSMLENWLGQHGCCFSLNGEILSAWILRGSSWDLSLATLLLTLLLSLGWIVSWVVCSFIGIWIGAHLLVNFITLQKPLI